MAGSSQKTNPQRYDYLRDIASEPMVKENEVFDVPPNVKKGALISSRIEYDQMYAKSLNTPDTFWSEQAKLLDWFQPFTKVSSGGFETGDIGWFLNGKLNACYNCVDRHLTKKANKVAIIYEGDEPGNTFQLTYRDLFHKVCKMANLLKSLGVKKGDTIAIYLPNTPEAAVSMLACARLGAIHSVIFAGFSAESMSARIKDAKCKLVITADETRRGGRAVPLKKSVDDAVKNCPSVEHVLVLKRNKTGNVPFQAPRDIWLTEALEPQPLHCPCEPIDSEDPLYILYTSGSTGAPKGLVHTTAGYLLYTLLTFKYVFDYRDSDIFGCMTDLGWVTGHSYILYGALANGATTFMFEGVPTYPTPSRYWDMIDRHRITQLYTAPTALRTLMGYGDDPVTPYKLSTLRILGTVGEPINPEAWKWYFEVVGRKQCAIVDTWWQTETGGHMITPIPGAIKTKPGSATLPFFGIEPAVLDPKNGKRLSGPCSGMLAIARPWPGITRTILNDPQRYLKTYMQPNPGYYLTGDGVTRDKDGYYWITGRIDDVINVSGHRIGTAEVEGVLTTHHECTEAAVVGYPHPVKGQGIAAYCVLANKEKESKHLEDELRQEIRKQIGGFANPDLLIFVKGLPKTRSGKIVRRVLRKVAEGEYSDLGDTSTLLDTEVVQSIIDKVKAFKDKGSGQKKEQQLKAKL